MFTNGLYLQSFVVLCFLALGIGLVLKIFKQPSVVAYILTGLAVSMLGAGATENSVIITELGNLGVVLLLFFVGTEISLPELIKKWRVAILGTLLQIALSVGLVYIIGYIFNWPAARSILLGFVVSLSSTAVVLNILERMNTLHSKLGSDVVSILLVQDIAVVPMLIFISTMNTAAVNTNELVLQLTGFGFILVFLIWLIKKKEITLPFEKKIKGDHELQILAAFVLCFGFALLTTFFSLSPALGAFLAGMLVSSAKETAWMHDSLHSFKVLFVALFFVSIGMLIDLNFVIRNFTSVIALVLLIFIAKTIVNALVFRWLGEPWRYSFYASSLTSQIGEFSFILAAVGLEVAVIADFEYKLAVSVIAISLLISPIWINLFSRHISNISEKPHPIKRHGP